MADKQIYYIDREVLGILAEAESELDKDTLQQDYEEKFTIASQAILETLLIEKGFNDSEIDSYFAYVREMDDKFFAVLDQLPDEDDENELSPEDKAKMDSIQKQITAEMQTKLDSDKRFAEIFDLVDSDGFQEKLDDMINSFNQTYYDAALPTLSETSKDKLDRYIKEVSFKENESIEQELDAVVDDLVKKNLNANTTQKPAEPSQPDQPTPAEQPTTDNQAQTRPQSPIDSYP